MKKKDVVEPPESDTAVTQVEMLGEQLADAFARKYLAVGGKSAAAVLELAETVWEAGDQLSPRQLRLFYEKVKLDPKGSTVVKLRAIGENADRFKPHIGSIPNNWTSLYRLAKLPLDQFSGLVSNGKLNAATTLNEINLAVGKQTGKAKKGIEVVLKVGVVSEPTRRAALVRALDALAEEYKAPMSAPGHADELIQLRNFSAEQNKAA